MYPNTITLSTITADSNLNRMYKTATIWPCIDTNRSICVHSYVNCLIQAKSCAIQ